MRLQYPLDSILGSVTNVRILRFLCRKGGVWNGRRVASELGMSPVTAHKALRKLHEATALDFKRVGNNFIYSLRDEHYLVRALLRPLFSREGQAYKRLQRLLQNTLSSRLRTQVISAAIYGSVATRRERPTSDIDLLILVPSEHEKQQARLVFEPLAQTLMKEFGNPLGLYVNTLREARGKLRRGLPIFQNILTHHDLVWGKPLREALNGRQTSPNTTG